MYNFLEAFLVVLHYNFKCLSESDCTDVRFPTPYQNKVLIFPRHTPLIYEDLFYTYFYPTVCRSGYKRQKYINNRNVNLSAAV